MRPQLNPLIFGPGAPWSLPGSSLDIQFTTGRAAVNRQTSSISSLLTTTRASTGYAVTSTGSLTLFPANTPRITDLGLLVEQAATNVLLRSQDYSATWGLTGAGTTQTAAQQTAPDGTLTGTLINPGTGNVAHGFFQSFTYTAAAYTYSAILKAGAYNYVTLDFTNVGSSGATFDLSNGTVGFTDTGVTATVTRLINGWYLCSITKTLTAVASFPEFYISSSRTANGRIWTTTGTETFYIWGSQLELGSFATSYIPTTTVSVTRAADAITLTNGTFPDTISIFASATLGNVSTGENLIGWGTANPNRASLSSSAGSPLFSNDSAGFNKSATGSWTVGTTGKMAARNLSSDYAVTFNGGTLGTSALTGGPSPITKVVIGANVDGGNPLNGYLRRLAIFKSALSNGQLQALTT